MNRLSLSVAVFGMGVALAAAAANADVKTFTADNDNFWITPENWTPSGVPGAGDRVVIPTNETCRIANTNAIADTVEIASGGALEVDHDSTLTLENDDDNIGPSGADHSLINGQLRLRGTQTSSARLIFDVEDHVVSGEGAIRGDFADCAVEIRGGRLLTNDISFTDASIGTVGFVGSMTIRRIPETFLTPVPAYFQNLGIVSAGYPGENSRTIRLDSTLEIADDEGAMWYIRTCKSSMKFDCPAPNLLGNFDVYEDIGGGLGVFVINQNVHTCGYYRHAGALEVASGKTFKYATFSIYSNCSNPGSAGWDPPSCNNPWIVSSGYYPCGPICE